MYNVYYIMESRQYKEVMLTPTEMLTLVSDIMSNDGEVTGIINSEQDC